MPAIGLGLTEFLAPAALGAGELGAEAAIPAVAELGIDAAAADAAGLAATFGGAGTFTGLEAGAEAGLGAAGGLGSTAFADELAGGLPLTTEASLASGVPFAESADLFGAGTNFGLAGAVPGVPDSAALATQAATTEAGFGSALPTFSPVGSAASASPFDSAAVAGDAFAGNTDALASTLVPGNTPTAAADLAAAAPAESAAAAADQTALAATPAATGAAPAAPAAATAAPAATPAAAAAAPAAADASGGGFTSFLKNNALTLGALGVGGGLLAKNALSAGKPLPQQGQLESTANQAAGASAGNQNLQNQLIQPLLTGKLPSEAEAGVQSGLNDAITATKAKFASLGMTGSTAETDSVNALHQQAEQLRFTIAEQMATTAMQAGSLAATDLNIQSGVFQALMNAQVSQDNALQSAIAAFAGQAAIAGAVTSRGNK
jgi:hypothetical protein